MRFTSLLLGGTAIASSSAAIAADQLKFGPLPSWVAEQTVPPASDKATERPVALLLHDEQSLLEPGKISTFSELAFKIQKPEGLAAGNLSIAWNPAFDTPTVNRLEIRRGNQVIDVLKSGQTFTTMRRESNLELAMLDGMLTANIQPEGLQEGDVILLATTIEHVDPVLKAHVETVFAPWGDAQIGLAHARIAWPSNVEVKLQKAGDLPAPTQSARDGRKVYEVTMRDVEPVIAPKGAPLRFKIGRTGEATDFRSWADAARLMTPLYREAAVISPSGPLRDEVEKIRKASSDSKVRAELALQLVQQRIRYVALAMGQGGLVPATAETSWARRFGDCKAKTALLLAILHEYGITAEPVLVNVIAGDAVADWLPMIGAFNHVLVRAHISGKDYWLDGTRSGDTSLDRIQVPNFGWGLPLVENAQLVHLVPAPLATPDSETRVEIDARAGIFAPAKVTVEETFRGDGAVAFDNGYSQLSADQRTDYLHHNAKTYFNSISGDSAAVEFAKSKGELRISTTGTAKLDWKDGWYSVPSSSVGFNPDFERPAGPQHDAPIATTYPNFDKRLVTIRLPPGFAADQKYLPAASHEMLAGVEYERAISLAGDVLTIESSERSIAPEVPYKMAVAAADRLKALADNDAYLRVPNGYRPSAADLPVLAEQTPSSAQQFLDRGNMYLDSGKFDEAIADFSGVLKLEPENKWALADRGIAKVWKGQFDAAESDLADADKRDPGNTVVLRARGLIAQFKGDCARAIDYFTQALVKEADNAFSVEHRATCEAILSRNDEALADTDKALRANPRLADLRVIRANIFMRQGNRDLVAGEADAMIRDNPTSDLAFVAAGKTYAAIGQTEKAMKALDRALAIKPQAYIYINRAQIRPKSDTAGRMADLDAALKLEPGSPDALAEKARILTSNGDYKGALAAVDQIKPDPNNRYAEMQRAVALYKAQRIADAEKVWADLRAQAKSAGELNNLCWSKAIVGVALDSALQDCRDALKLSPDSGQYLDSLGMVLLKLGQLDEALVAYNKAVAKNTGADSLMGRAFVYLRKGDRAHAEADAAAARKLFDNIDDVFVDYGLKFDAKAGATAAH